MKNKLIFTVITLMFLAGAGFAQSTSFTFQGKLNDGGIPANGTYQFEFKLFGADDAQVGQTLTDVPATVTNGIFTVNLDFSAESFDGSPRFLEIGVRLNGTGQNYTLLNPRQPIASTPYAIKSLKADSASVASVASDAIRLGNLPASQYTQTNDARLSDARPPTAFSTFYIQNGTSPQTASNFNISGEGKANIFSAATQFNIGSNRVLSVAGNGNSFVGLSAGTDNTGTSNSFVGAFAGEKNTTGNLNSFFGRNAGQKNLNGSRNSFFGVNSGLANTAGSENSFFGLESGYSNSIGSSNAFFGNYAGKANTDGSFNSFFGRSAGVSNKTGIQNSFFGRDAGFNTTTGSDNTFVGASSGFTNQTGESNSFFGFLAGRFTNSGSRNTFAGTNAGASNTSGSSNSYFGYNAQGAPGITNATAIGANSYVATSDTMVLGTNAVTVQVPGNLTVLNTFSANALNSATVYKINNNRVFHLTGTENTSVGFESGNSISTGSLNAFFGTYSGKGTTTGFNNSFFGSYAGRDNTTGTNNSLFGANAGLSNRASFNSFFGSGAGISNVNGANNSFFGTSSGSNNGSGQNNSFFGFKSGEFVSTGSNNTFIGTLSGAASAAAGAISNNTGIGYNVRFGTGVANSVAIGADITVNTSNTVKIGNGSDTVELGLLKIGKVTASFGTSTFPSIVSDLVTTDKLNSAEIFTQELTFQFNGLDNEPTLPLCYVQIGFSYKPSPCQPDLQKIESGQINGAPADSVKNQQTRIAAVETENQKLQDQLKQQQAQIEALKSLVCAHNPNAPVCAAPEKK